MRTAVLLIEKLSLAAGYAAALLIVPLIFVTVYEVLARYALNAPTTWGYELGSMLTGAYFALGIAYALRERAHVRIDVFYNKMSGKAQALITMTGYVVLFLPVSWWLAWALWEYTFQGYVSGEGTGLSAWSPPVWPFRAIVAAGFTVLALQVSAELVKFFCIFRGASLVDRPDKEDFRAG